MEWLTLALPNPDMPCLCKQQYRSRSVGQLIWICTVCNLQSSRKRRFRRIFTPIFAFVRVKFHSEDSHLRPIATGRPNWTSKTYRGLPKFLLSVEIDTRNVQKLSKSPPTFDELYDVCPAYLLEIRYLCWLSFPLAGVLLTSVSSVAAPFWWLRDHCVYLSRVLSWIIDVCISKLSSATPENIRWNYMKSLLFLNIHVLKS